MARAKTNNLEIDKALLTGQCHLIAHVQETMQICQMPSFAEFGNKTQTRFPDSTS
jgi:hypothetical protein